MLGARGRLRYSLWFVCHHYVTSYNIFTFIWSGPKQIHRTKPFLRISLQSMYPYIHYLVYKIPPHLCILSQINPVRVPKQFLQNQFYILLFSIYA